MIDEDLAETIAGLGENLTGVGKTGLWITTVLIFLLNFQMNSFLSQVRSLSIITHMLIVPVRYSAAISTFFSVVFEFVTFEIVPSGIFLDPTFTLDDAIYS